MRIVCTASCFRSILLRLTALGVLVAGVGCRSTATERVAVDAVAMGGDGAIALLTSHQQRPGDRWFDRAIEVLAPDGERAWRSVVGSGGRDSELALALDRGEVVLARLSGAPEASVQLVLLSDTGAPRWSVQLDLGPGVGAPVIAFGSERVVVWRGSVASVERATGKLQWSHSLPGASGLLRLDDDRVIAANQLGTWLVSPDGVMSPAAFDGRGCLESGRLTTVGRTSENRRGIVQYDLASKAMVALDVPADERFADLELAGCYRRGESYVFVGRGANDVPAVAIASPSGRLSRLSIGAGRLVSAPSSPVESGRDWPRYMPLVVFEAGHNRLQIVDLDTLTWHAAAVGVPVRHQLARAGVEVVIAGAERSSILDTRTGHVRATREHQRAVWAVGNSGLWLAGWRFRRELAWARLDISTLSLRATRDFSIADLTIAGGGNALSRDRL